MKILCFIDCLSSGGAQRQMVNLAIGFSKKGHDVSFLVYFKDDFYREKLTSHHIDIHEFIEPKFIPRILKIRKFIRKGNYDSVLSFLTTPNFISEISTLPHKNWKLVVGERSADPSISKSFKKVFFRLFHVFSNYIVSNSNSNINMVKKVNPFLLNKKLRIIYNTVDNKVWDPDLRIKNNKKPFKLIVVAGHRYLKNLSGLIESINLLEYKFRERLEISWYGSNLNDDSLEKGKETISKYGLDNIFSFHSPIHNIELKMAESDCLGLFSHYEGLPNVICEAMSIGIPVIGSNVSDIPFLLNNKKLLFSPNEPKEIAESIRYIMNCSLHEIETISSNNIKRATELFDNEEITKGYLNLLSN